MKMNAFSIVALSMVLALSSCADIENAEIKRLSEVNKSLEAELESRSQSVESLLQGLEIVQEDMRDISIREGLLEGKTVSEAELARSPQEQIMEDIGLVDGLIQKSRDRIEALEMKVKRSDGKLYEFERVIANLKLDLLDKENDLVIFKENLVAMEENYATLLEDYQAQSILTGMQDIALHRAYFAYGSKDELIEGEVVQKTGGVLGVGKTWELKDDFNKEYFTEVDIRTIDRIPLSSEKVELLSQHPNDAYELVMENKLVKELRITDADRFWSGSRYLAMMVE
jgi:hypothetical protein